MSDNENENGGGGGGAGGENTQKGVRINVKQKENTFNIPYLSNLNEANNDEEITNNVRAFYESLPINVAKRMRPVKPKTKKGSKFLKSHLDKLILRGNLTTKNQVFSEMVKYKERVSQIIRLIQLIRRIEQNSGKTITDLDSVLTTLIIDPDIVSSEEYTLLFTLDKPTLQHVLNKLRESNRQESYAHEFAQNVAGIPVNEGPDENVNTFMKRKLANKTRSISNVNKVKYYTRKQGKYLGKGGGIRVLRSILKAPGAPRTSEFPLMISNNVRASTYRKPRLSNLNHPTDPRLYAPNVNQAILNYHASIRDPSNPDMPTELISARGQSPGTATKGEGKSTRAYRRDLLNMGVTGQEMENAIRLYKNRFSQQAHMMGDIRNVQERTGMLEYGENNIGNMVGTAIDYHNVLDPRVVNRLLSVENEELNEVKGKLSEKKIKAIIDNVFATYYSRLNVTNANTEETIRNKFIMLIYGLDPDVQTWLMQRFNAIHPPLV